MDNTKTFYQVLSKSTEIALATTVNDVPNVRLVNFCYDPARTGILYFTSDRENKKVAEFNQNNKIAFTTVPADGNAVPHARSNNATVQKSKHRIDEVKDLFIAKIPGYDEALTAIGERLDVFEIHVNEAIVIVDFEKAEQVSFDV